MLTFIYYKCTSYILHYNCNCEIVRYERNIIQYKYTALSMYSTPHKLTLEIKSSFLRIP